MVEMKVTEQQRQAALRRALLEGGKALVELTSGQQRALSAYAPLPDPQDKPSRDAAPDYV